MMQTQPPASFSRPAVGFSAVILALAVLLASLARKPGPAVSFGASDTDAARRAKADFEIGQNLSRSAEGIFDDNEELFREAWSFYMSSWRSLMGAEYPAGQLIGGDPDLRALKEKLKERILYTQGEAGLEEADSK